MRIGSLFSGAGGLDMAVEQVFGGEVIWQAEVDKAASKVLAYRFPCALNLGDITQIDWKTVEPVDVLCLGFPCQDVSAAGKRAGIKDGTRSGLWSYAADAIDQLRPPLVVIENVRGLLSAQAHRNVEPDEGTMGDRSDGPVLRALGAVLGDLADLGYDAQWATVAAADVGAPHRRERVFILATTGDSSSQGLVRIATGPEIHQPGDRHLPAGRQEIVTGPREILESSTEWCEQCWISDGSETCLADPDYGDFRPGVVLLPTPTTSDSRGAKCGGAHDENVRVPRLAAAVEVDLPKEIALLPTPNAQDGNGGRYSSDGHQSTLPGEVRLLPTPRSSDCFGAGQHGDGGLDLRTTISLLPTPRSHRRGDCESERNRNNPDLEATTHYFPLGQWGKYEPAIRRWEQINGPAPSPTEPNKNGNPRLSAAFSEWMMGWPPGWVTDPDIGISRNDQLKIVGNGVCPQQATAALRYLLTVAKAVA